MRFRVTMCSPLLRSGLLAIFAVCSAIPSAAPQSDSPAPRAFTGNDYQRAEKFMTYNTRPLVFHEVRGKWLPEDRYLFRDSGPEGSEFVIFDAAHGTRQPAFDHGKVAAALSAAAGATYNAAHLPFTTLEFSADGKSISFHLKSENWACDLQAGKCTAEAKSAKGATERPEEENSPDGKSAAFIRDYNLWVRDVASGRETQLTADGVKDFAYATDNAGWIHSNRPILLWSPDSRKIATFQQDQRGVGEMYLVETKVGHPVLEAWKYPLPGDDVVTTIQRVVIDLDAHKVVRLELPADQHRATLCDDVECRGSDWDDVEWSPDATHLAFVSTSRDHKQERLRVADAATGAVRDVLEETAATQYESGWGRVNWRYLPGSNEIVWFSERDDWAHLYLYDLATGKLKNQITSGDWVVTQLLRVDEKNRALYFLGL